MRWGWLRAEDPSLQNRARAGCALAYGVWEQEEAKGWQVAADFMRVLRGMATALVRALSFKETSA